MRPWALRRARALRRRFAGERGYALPELITAMAILTIVIGGLGDIFVSASHAEIDMNSRFQAQQQALIGLDKLRREVHCASAVTQVGGSALVSSGLYSAITLTLPSSCVTGNGSATWCVVANGSKFDLYRYASTSCSGTGRRWTSSVMNPHPFSVPCSLPSSAYLAMLHVDLPVNVTSGATYTAPTCSTSATASAKTYRLVDDMVLRNASR